ncbi:MAG: lipoyl synthase [Bacteroidales bacterium]|nr:lipoyl synthase [Bacteroidales bacterium]MBN2819172.1 lipoyl synthase [Bacteroidales bacterium]
MSENSNKIHRLPRWLKVPLPKGEGYSRVKNLVSKQKLNTICVSGNCPNKGECWSAGTATFMILGEKCTRNCKFCQVYTLKPGAVDYEEPLRLAETIKSLSLKHAVITSVARDELHDGGSEFWAECIRKVKELNPNTTMEVLIPDFRRGNSALDRVIAEKPEVISHNLETVKRLSPEVRSMARYESSLELLRYVAESGLIAKTGIMLGLGESYDEVIETMKDARKVGVKVFTLGQYLRPSPEHYPVKEYVHPDVFAKLKEEGLNMGYAYVESGPQVRSSYHAELHVNA